MTVSAKDKSTDKEESVKITNDKGRLTPEEIESKPLTTPLIF